MINEKFVEAIAALAEKAAGAKLIEDKAIPRMHWLQVGDQLKELEVPPTNRQHSTDTADSFSAAVSELAAETGASVWINRHFTTCLLDDADRRDIIHFPMPWTVEFKLLFSWSVSTEGPASLTQKELIRNLKFKLPHQLPGLLADIRKLIWRMDGTSVSNRGHGQDTLGKSVDAKCSAARDLPELVSVEVPVFDVPDLRQTRYPIGLALEVDATEERFYIGPPAGEIERALAAAQKDLAVRIDEDTPDYVRVYIGTA